MNAANLFRTTDHEAGARPGRAIGDAAAEGGALAAGSAPALVIVTSGISATAADQRRAAKVRRSLPEPTAAVIVDLARNFITAHLARRLSAEDLVSASGVSESTLRRALHARTGETLSQLIMTIRLDQAWAWLSTNRESRTQAEIAAALGFRAAGVFARAYRRRFGETMSQTRRRAVQSRAGVAGPDKSSCVART